jgi:hypothetical protein
VVDLGPGDYRVCKQALADVDSHTGSGARILGAVRYGGRQQWAAVVELWEEMAGKYGEIAHIILWDDGKATVWDGSLESYQDQDPLPWDEMRS